MEDRREAEFLSTDDPLREDVGRLGAMVGRMLAEQGGEAFFQRVEQVRLAAIRRRREHAPVTELAASLAGLGAADAEALARAFATYFQAVNTAERVHRIRRRRDYQREGSAPQPESLLDVLGRLKAAGVSAEELVGWLDRLWIEPVFTAHPTEAVRRSLLEKEQAIVRSLIDGFDGNRTPQERREDDDRIYMALSAGWQTAEASPVRPSVQDEREHVGFYLANPLYRIVPALYEALAQALSATYGVAVRLPQVLRFASWVGGDMDGNPNVGADTIAACLQAQRALVLERYREDVSALARLLSQTDDRVAVTPALRARLVDYRARFPDAAARIRPRHADMPYRCLLQLIDARLALTQQDAMDGYTSIQSLLDDLQLIADSLLQHRGLHAGAYAVERLRWRARSFGFHLARLDVRQDSRVHDDALAALLDEPAWAQLPTDERTLTLRDYASGAALFPISHAEVVTALYDVFATMGDARRRYGGEAVGLYIISMARSAADVLAVLALARYGGLVESRPLLRMGEGPGERAGVRGHAGGEPASKRASIEHDASTRPSSQSSSTREGTPFGRRRGEGARRCAVLWLTPTPGWRAVRPSRRSGAPLRATARLARGPWPCGRCGRPGRGIAASVRAGRGAGPCGTVVRVTATAVRLSPARRSRARWPAAVPVAVD